MPFSEMGGRWKSVGDSEWLETLAQMLTIVELYLIILSNLLYGSWEGEEVWDKGMELSARCEGKGNGVGTFYKF